MRLRLVCGPDREAAVRELLGDRDLGPDEGAEVSIVEKGMGVLGPIAIVFDPGDIAALVPVLDAMAGRRGEPPASIAIRRDGRIELVPLKQALYFESGAFGVRCVTAVAEGEVREKLYELEERLPGARFCRVSKSAIVNLGAVKEVHPWFGRRLLLRFGAPNRQVEVSKNYVRVLKDRLGL